MSNYHDLFIEIDFTREERDFVYYQLSARKDYFEEDMVNAASKKDLVRISECTAAINQIEKIQKKLLSN